MSGADARPRAAVVIVSDRAASGERPDETAARLAPRLEAAGYAVREARIVPDERDRVATALREAAREAELVLSSGGTGLGARDVTPEATLDVVERVVPGLGEAMRAASRPRTPFADLSRATAGTIGPTLIVNLPGSPSGAVECLDAILAAAGHAVRLLRGAVRDCADEAGRDRP